MTPTAPIPVVCPSCERKGTLHYYVPRIRCACGYEGPTPPEVMAEARRRLDIRSKQAAAAWYADRNPRIKETP